MTNPSVIEFERSLPEFLTSKQLVELGLWPREDAVYLARIRGLSPDYVRLGKKILYPKSAVIAFIRRNLKRGDVPIQDGVSK